ncbi:MAG: hypothetical protein Fur0018_26400 [Anaerolineales bacterium]
MLAMCYAIETHALTKVYPPRGSLLGWLHPAETPHVAVQDIGLRVARGEIFGLLGPNGAGKTTLIKILSTLILPTSGEARVNGWELCNEQAIKSSIGLVTAGERTFYWRLTGLENLEFFAALQGMAASERRARCEHILAQVGLAQAAHQRVGEYSTGMHKRLAIARALLHEPDLLFLDEPTSGLDPQAAIAFHALIRHLSADGKTMLISTHDLSEAEKLCTRLAILHRGRLHATGTVSELRRILPWQPRYHIQVSGLPEASRLELEKRLGSLSPAEDAPPETSFTLEGSESLPLALEIISPAYLQALIPAWPSLASVFEFALQEPQEIPPAQELTAPRTDVFLARPWTSVFKTFAAFLQRDWRIERSYRLAFLLQLGRMAFSVGIFYFIGALVNLLDLDLLRSYGGDYFTFVLIGLAMHGYFGTALTSFSQSIRLEQTTGTLEAMLTTPARLETIIFGSALWNYVMTSLNLVLYLVAGWALGRLHLGQANLLAAALTLLLSLLTYSSLGVLSASFTMIYKRGDPVNWVFQALSDFLGGLYYPVEVLPAALQFLAAFLPVTYSLSAMRLTVIQGASWAMVWPDMAVLTGFAVFLLPFSILAFRYAVRRVRIQGTLVGY